MIFVDGVGLGEPDIVSNPLARPWPGMGRFTGGAPWTEGTAFRSTGHLFQGIDANLGLEGLPQSGTGQATLFTGVNCAALAGRHFGPFPHSASREAIRTASVFQRVGSSRCCFANAYPPRFFRWTSTRDRWPVTTRACLDAGVRIRTLEDLERGQALAADITGSGLARGLQLPVTELEPEQAAHRLTELAGSHSFTLFEVFHTDKAGHAQDMAKAESILGPLDAFLDAIAERLPAGMTVILSSDHGNLEDLSVKTHTRNPVPLAVLGPAAEAFSGVEDLTGVTPVIDRLLQESTG